MALEALVVDVKRSMPKGVQAAPLIDGKAQNGASRPVLSPVDGAPVGTVIEADAATATAAMAAAQAGFASDSTGWAAPPCRSPPRAS